MIGQKITATKGYVFRRISDGMLFGHEIYLGMAYPTDKEPYEELPEHFEEIPDPLEADAIFIAEAIPLVYDNHSEERKLIDEPVSVEESVKSPVTLADYRELERKVEFLMKIIGEV